MDSIGDIASESDKSKLIAGTAVVLDEEKNAEWFVQVPEGK